MVTFLLPSKLALPLTAPVNVMVRAVESFSAEVAAPPALDAPA